MRFYLLSELYQSTELYSLPLLKLHSLFNLCLETTITNHYSNPYKLTAIILDIASHWLFKQMHIGKDEKEKRSFLILFFANKGLDDVNLGNILHHKLVKSEYLPILMISLYQSFLIPISNQLQLKFSITNMCCRIPRMTIECKSKPSDCTCGSSSFIYKLADHLLPVTSTLSITLPSEMCYPKISLA